MAVPINYYPAKKWNKFENKFISGLFNGCLALDRLRWTSQDANSESQLGDLDVTSLGELRVLRFGLIGTFKFKKPWVYTVFFTNNTFDRGYDSKTDNSLMLYDLRVDIPLPSNITLSVGKQKEPISMERLTTLLFLPWQERQAAADAFLPARNVGALLQWYSRQPTCHLGSWCIQKLDRIRHYVCRNAYPGNGPYYGSSLSIKRRKQFASPRCRPSILKCKTTREKERLRRIFSFTCFY
ncbi:MAG: hypothetical protein IPJ20_25685 [Flammeovirgaceae bacterium]|nr:hypothetical protein [Flammeovirgaceae bacterium]